MVLSHVWPHKKNSQKKHPKFENLKGGDEIPSASVLTITFYEKRYLSRASTSSAAASISVNRITAEIERLCC